MLQIISQFITNEQELNKYEKANHADAFEYMPMSKGKPYTEMVDVDEEPVTFLAIRVTAFEGEPAESELLNNGNINNANLRVLSALNRVLSKFSDEFEVLSMSYQTLKLKTDGVRFMLDEFANIGQIPDFTKKLATMRKYEISSTVILQNLAQIKNMYKDDWGSIMGNCDSFVFLGCPENDTLEYVSKMLGKETITVRDHSTSKGGKGSSSLSYKQQGRELATPDELRRMKDNECIFVLRGEQPYRGLKHQYDTHDNYKYTADANESNVYHFKKKKQKQNLSAPSASSVPSLSSANTLTEMINNSNVPNNDISEEMMKRNLMYRNEGIMESNEKIYSTRPTVNDISVAEMLQQSIDEGKIDSEMYNELIQEFPNTLQEELKSNIKNTNTTTSDTISNNNTESSKSNSINDFRFLSSLGSSDSDK